MLLLASSVCGLFKWRQFEPEVILLAVGWYLRFSLSYREVEESLPSASVCRPRHRLEMGATLRPGIGTTFALEAQTDQRLLAGRRDVRPGQRQMGILVPGC